MLSHLYPQFRASTGYEPLLFFELIQVVSDHRPRTQTPDMTDSKMEEVNKLKGKTNLISWKREFERTAKANDTFEYLNGEEVVPPKPKKEDYFAKPVKTRRPVQAKKAVKTATQATDDDDETDDAQTIIMSTNNNLRWQIDHNEHKNAKEKMKLASKLLDAWVSDGIKIEIEDCADAKEAYDFIQKRYVVTNGRARDNLLNQLNELILDDCSSMTEYTNRVRQIKADLKTVKYDMTDDMLATALLHGLPSKFRDFKEKYDWVRSTKPDDPPDLDYLYERLHVEEDKQIRLKEERKTKDRAKRETSGRNNSNSKEDNIDGGANQDHTTKTMATTKRTISVVLSVASLAQKTVGDFIFREETFMSCAGLYSTWTTTPELPKLLLSLPCSGALGVGPKLRL
jgi:hypothetical protein